MALTFRVLLGHFVAIDHQATSLPVGIDSVHHSDTQQVHKNQQQCATNVAISQFIVEFLGPWILALLMARDWVCCSGSLGILACSCQRVSDRELFIALAGFWLSVVLIFFSPSSVRVSRASWLFSSIVGLTSTVMFENDHTHKMQVDISSEMNLRALS